MLALSAADCSTGTVSEACAGRSAGQLPLSVMERRVASRLLLGCCVAALHQAF